jgi:hypothetical protein
MDMGNERSLFEVRVFQMLFGKNKVVDGTGGQYARLCLKVARMVPGEKTMYSASSGNIKLFRALCCGSHIFAGSTLALPDGGELVMPRREVKKYLSAVEVQDKEGKRSYDIAVNHPASFGPWKIYQYSYDASRGKWSTTSVLECVKDGWYVAVQTGMWLILAGGVMMCVRGWSNRKRRKEGDA